MAGRHIREPRRFGPGSWVLVGIGVATLIARVFFGVGAVHHAAHHIHNNGAAVIGTCDTTVKDPSPTPTGTDSDPSPDSDAPCDSIESFAGDPGIALAPPMTVDYLCGIAIPNASKLTQSDQDKLWGWCDNASGYADAGNATDCMKQLAAVIRDANMADDTTDFNPDTLARACTVGSSV